MYMRTRTRNRSVILLLVLALAIMTVGAVPAGATTTRQSVEFTAVPDFDSLIMGSIWQAGNVLHVRDTYLEYDLDVSLGELPFHRVALTISSDVSLRTGTGAIRASWESVGEGFEGVFTGTIEGRIFAVGQNPLDQIGFDTELRAHGSGQYKNWQLRADGHAEVDSPLASHSGVVFTAGDK